MVLCYVPSCKNRSDHRNWKTNVNRGFKVTFHSFPKNAVTRSLWLDILGINSPSIPKGARVCSMHFEEKFLDKSSPSLVRLKPNALPQLKKEFLIEPATERNVLDATTTIQIQASHPDQNSGITLALHRVQHLQTMPHKASLAVTESPIWESSMSKVDKAPMLSLKDFSKISNEYCSSVKPPTSKADKSTMTSFEQVYLSPEKCRLRRRIEFVKEEAGKKIRNLQQNLRRQTDKVATLKSILQTLREKQVLNKDQANMLHTT